MEERWGRDTKRQNIRRTCREESCTWETGEVRCSAKTSERCGVSGQRAVWTASQIFSCSSRPGRQHDYFVAIKPYLQGLMIDHGELLQAVLTGGEKCREGSDQKRAASAVLQTLVFKIPDATRSTDGF